MVVSSFYETLEEVTAPFRVLILDVVRAWSCRWSLFRDIGSNEEAMIRDTLIQTCIFSMCSLYL